MVPVLLSRGGEMAFRPGDRVQWGDGKAGTVVSKPRQYDLMCGDSFTGVAVEVLPDESTFSINVTLLYVATLTRLKGPRTVVMVNLDDEEALEEIMRADPLRGVNSVDRAAWGLQRTNHARRQACRGA
jgi:hypothetical protein